MLRHSSVQVITLHDLTNVVYVVLIDIDFPEEILSIETGLLASVRLRFDRFASFYQRKGLFCHQHYFNLGIYFVIHRDGQFRIPNPKDSNPKLSESNNRIQFISSLQALSRCLVIDFLFVKVSNTCSVPSKILVSA